MTGVDERHGKLSEGALGPGRSLKQVAYGASVWTLIGQATGQVIRLAGNLVLTRLLYPEAFGLMLLVNTVVAGLNLFSDFGVGPYVIHQKRSDDPDLLNTAWSVQILRGFCLWVLVCALALPMSWFYEDPRLMGLLPVVGLTAILSGFESVWLVVINKRLQMRRLVSFEIAGQLAMSTFPIAVALIWPSVWSLAIGGVLSCAARCLLSHWITPEHQHRLRWSPETVRSMLRFGRWILISTAVTFLATQSDRLILGSLVPKDVLGVYAIAVMLVSVLREVMNRIDHRVLFPALSIKMSSGERGMAAALTRARRAALVVAAPVVALLVVGLDPLVDLLYDERYRAAGPMASILAFSLWITALSFGYAPALLAGGHSKSLAFANALRAACVVAGIPLGFWLADLQGAVVAVAVAELPRYAALLRGMKRERLAYWPVDLLMTALFGVCLVAAGALRSHTIG